MCLKDRKEWMGIDIHCKDIYPTAFLWAQHTAIHFRGTILGSQLPEAAAAVCGGGGAGEYLSFWERCQNPQCEDEDAIDRDDCVCSMQYKLA